jgi:hypothetical protein
MNAIPIIGWLVSLTMNVSLAVPFWIVWTLCGIGSKFAYFLPEVYKAPGFWEVVGIFIAISILKGAVPKVASVTQSNNK